MRNVGYQHAQFTILDQHALGKDKVTATVAWRVAVNDSNVDFRTLYICHFVDHKWLVFNANVYQGSFSNTQRNEI